MSCLPNEFSGFASSSPFFIALRTHSLISWRTSPVSVGPEVAGVASLCFESPPPLSVGEGNNETYFFVFGKCWYRRLIRQRLPSTFNGVNRGETHEDIIKVYAVLEERFFDFPSCFAIERCVF